MDCRINRSNNRRVSKLVLALLTCAIHSGQANQLTESNQNKLFHYLQQQDSISGNMIGTGRPMVEDEEFLQLDADIGQTQTLSQKQLLDSSTDSSENQQATAASSEEQAYQQQKEQHRHEVQAYKQWFKYSPFYLRHHPEQREAGDIQDIQQMSQKRSSNGDELAGVENVFEKNFNQFNKLLSHSDASEQLAQVRTRFDPNSPSQSASKDSRHRQAQIQRVKKQIQKKKRQQRQQKKKGMHSITVKPPMAQPAVSRLPKQRQQKQMKNAKLGKPTRTRKSKKILQKAVTNFNQQQLQGEKAAERNRFDHMENQLQDDYQLFQSKQAQQVGEQKLTIVPNVRSFDSAGLEPNPLTGDYSKEAQAMTQPSRGVMDKIAQLETQVLAMGHRIQQLEIEKKEDEGQLQLLQTRVRHFEEVELPGKGGPTHPGYIINEADTDKDAMNLQLDEENVILDAITSLKDSIASLFTSTKSKEKAPAEGTKQQNATKAKHETSLDRLNRVLKESDERAARKLKEEQAQNHTKPGSQYQSDQVKDAVNLQIASNNEMHLLSELEAVGNWINKTRKQQMMQKSADEAARMKKQYQSAPGSPERTKSWATIKAEARAKLQEGKDADKENVTNTHSDSKAQAGRPLDVLNLQAENSQEASEEAFEEQLQDDISLVGLNPYERPYLLHSQLARRRNIDADPESEDGPPQPVPYTQARPDNVRTLKAGATVSRRDAWGPKRAGKYNLDRDWESDFESDYDPEDNVSARKQKESMKKMKKATKPKKEKKEKKDKKDWKPMKEIYPKKEKSEKKEKVPKMPMNKKIHNKARKIKKALKESVDEENQYRRRREAADLKEKLQNDEDIIDFESNTRSFKAPARTWADERRLLKKLKRKHRKAAKARADAEEDSEDAEADKKKKQSKKDEDATESASDKSSIEKLRRLDRSIRRAQPTVEEPREQSEDPSERRRARKTKAKVIKPAAKEVGEVPESSNETTTGQSTELPSDPSPPSNSSTSDAEAVKKAIDIISESKAADQTAGALKGIFAKATADGAEGSLRDHIKKAVEETVKQEVGNITRPELPVPPPVSAEEKREIVKTKKIQDEIAKEIKERGIDKKAAREVEAKERQTQLTKVQKKLNTEIQKNQNEERRAATIGNQLKEHQREVAKALDDTKRYRKANKQSEGRRLPRSGRSYAYDYGTAGADDEVHGGSVYSKRATKLDNSIVYPRVKPERRFRRASNDDDNPSVPELEGPPVKGKTEIGGADEDKPRLTKKESEDFDRLVKEAKEAKAKAEKEKKEKEEKEKKEGKKDDAAKAFSQTSSHKHRHHHRRHDYLQLSQDVQMNQVQSQSQNGTEIRNGTQNATSTTATPNVKQVNITKPVTAKDTQKSDQSKKVNQSAPASAAAVLKSQNSSGSIDLVQKLSVVNATKQKKKTKQDESSKTVKVNSTQSAKSETKVVKSKPAIASTVDQKNNKTHSQVREIEELDDDTTDMGTESDIVESQEEQDQDFHAAELQEQAAVETETEHQDSFTSHTDQSLREEQEKWTQAEEMDEQKRLKVELEQQKKKQAELLKSEAQDKENEKKEKEQEEKEEASFKEKKVKEEQALEKKLDSLNKLEEEAKQKLKMEEDKLKADEQKEHAEVEKTIAASTKKIEDEDKTVQSEISQQEKLVELEEKQVERELERERQREMDQEKKLMQLNQTKSSSDSSLKNESQQS